MRLYLWEGVLEDYTEGVMFALADSVEEAKRLIHTSDHRDCEDENCFYLQEMERVQPRIIEEPFGFLLWGGS